MRVSEEHCCNSMVSGLDFIISSTSRHLFLEESDYRSRLSMSKGCTQSKHK